MTFCLGIKLKGGLVGLADTRITSGNEVFLAKKVATFQQHGYPMFLMTSGLRSVRDKVLTYFEDELEQGRRLDRLYKAANAFGAQVRTGRDEDGQTLAESHLTLTSTPSSAAAFPPTPNLSFTWSTPRELGRDRRSPPYHIIGESGYGGPSWTGA